jgi:hypothetical protein
MWKNDVVDEMLQPYNQLDIEKGRGKRLFHSE